MTGGCQCRPTDPACGCGAAWPGADDVGLTETLAEHEPVIGVFGRRGGIVGCSCLPARDYRAAGFCAGQEGYRAHLADALAARVAAERERADAAMAGAARIAPYDEDGYCKWCGNGSWKPHAPACGWADLRDARAAAWDEGWQAAVGLTEARVALRREIGPPTDRDDKWQPMVSAGEVRALLDALDAADARVAAERERADALDERIDALRDELAYAIRTRDEWEANADAAEAKIAAVEALADKWEREFRAGFREYPDYVTLRAALADTGEPT